APPPAALFPYTTLFRSDWARPFVQLRDLVAALRADVQVELAFLDMMQPALPDLAARLAAAGCGAVTIVPMFLGQGGHVLRDLPRSEEHTSELQSRENLV